MKAEISCLEMSFSSAGLGGFWSESGFRSRSVKGDIFVIIPNPHRGDIGIDLINKILRRAEIDRDDWFSA